ncbi:class II fumarate hydratase [Aliiglaciecola litoralis]|uniref:fumarate hydratase n=1 Tax=Aliiglaciecola litoralis TaxID=582857 RepID=A0ABP3X237_9ALTE
MLYGKETKKALDNFPISGLIMPAEFIHSLAKIKYACAIANSKLGKLEPEIADGISKAATLIADGQYDQEFVVDIFQTGSGTSTNMNMNEVISQLCKDLYGLDVHPNDQANMSQSSNDTIPSAIHLSAYLKTKNSLIPSLQGLSETLKSRAESLQTTIKTGRTHLMDALPMSMGQELSGWNKQITNNIARIESCYERLGKLALGGSAIGTGLNSGDDFANAACNILSDLTGINFTTNDNLFEAISAQDTAVELSGHLKTLAVSLMKISNDLRWQNSGPLAGLGEIALPELQAGSSIMPGKVNPVIPEAVCMVCAQVMGNDATIAISGQGGNFQLNTYLPVIAYNLLQSLEILSNSARLLGEKVVSQFQVNEKKLQETLAYNPILVTSLNSLIGYQAAAKIAKHAYKTNRQILEVAKEMTDIDHQELTRLLDPNNLV